MNAPADERDLQGLVNQLAQELAQSQRALQDAQRKLGSASRQLEGRTQELTEARAALTLLLATLDSAADGILAVGYFGRAMHYNRRFIEMWGIPQDKLAALNEAALTTLQLTQVKDPAAFLAHDETRRSHPDGEHVQLVELTDGRVFECRMMPQRVKGRRVGSVTCYHDVTERERLGRLLCVLESEWPQQVAEARATVY